MTEVTRLKEKLHLALLNCVDSEMFARASLATIDELRAEVARLRKWIDDLQAGMYINCVYCGHRYGPDDEVPSSMAEVLKDHVEQCPDHPMSRLRADVEVLREDVDLWRTAAGTLAHARPVLRAAVHWRACDRICTDGCPTAADLSDQTIADMTLAATIDAIPPEMVEKWKEVGE